MKERATGLDIIRCIAITFVLSIHFFLRTGFYAQPLEGVGDFFALFARQLLYICVPLFILLTGYLNTSRKFDKSYFYKLAKVIISYLLISVIAIVFEKYILHEPITLKGAVRTLLDFSADPYSWYVEMYIGLFIAAPFLNVLFDALGNKKNRAVLVTVCLFATAVPAALNSFSYGETRIQFLPEYWTQIYPITYFFIGKYLKEYPIKMKDMKKAVLLAVTVSINTLVSFLYIYNKEFDWGVLGGYGGLLTVIASVLAFSLFADKNIRNRGVKAAVTTVSVVSFEMYLISYVFDRLVYESAWVQSMSIAPIGKFFVCVISVFILSFVSAFILNKLTAFLYERLKPIYNKISGKITDKFAGSKYFEE